MKDIQAWEIHKETMKDRNVKIFRRGASYMYDAYAHIHTHTHIYIYIHTYTSVTIYLNKYIYIYIYIYIFIYTYTYTRVYMYIRSYLVVCVCLLHLEQFVVGRDVQDVATASCFGYTPPSFLLRATHLMLYQSFGERFLSQSNLKRSPIYSRRHGRRP